MTGYIDAGGVHTYYGVRGAGDPVVMLHGGFATIETWEAQAAALAERYRVPARVPDAQLAVVPGTDHGLLVEKPELVSRLFLDFLAVEQPPKLMS